MRTEMGAAPNGTMPRVARDAPTDPRPRGKRERVQLAVPLALHDKMKEVQGETGAETLTEVVRDALITYLALVREYKDGKEVIVRSPDGQEKSYALFMRN